MRVCVHIYRYVYILCVRSYIYDRKDTYLLYKISQIGR